MNTIDLTPNELDIVQTIMHEYPNTVVFGSRSKGTSKKSSDLDLCIKDPITPYQLELLKEAFEESDLPFFIDLVIYQRCNDAFKEVIDSHFVNLW